MNHLPAANDISLVNLAARQRMLSQRLALQILLAAQGRDGMEQAAHATLRLFADSQAQLLGTVSRLPATDAAALQAVYQGPGGVQRLIDSFITHAKDALAPGPLRARALAWLVDHIDEVLAALADQGIELEILATGDAGSMTAGAVLAAGAPTADLIFGVDNTLVTRAIEAGVFSPYSSPELANLEPEFQEMTLWPILNQSFRR